MAEIDSERDRTSMAILPQQDENPRADSIHQRLYTST